MKHLFLSFILCVSSVCYVEVHGQAGEPDLSFGQDGWFYYETEGLNDVDQMTILPDGKILIRYGTNLMRILPTGIIDNTFNFTGIYEGAFSFGLQADGKILILAYKKDLDSGRDEPHLCRLQSNGLPDLTFGSQGSVNLSKRIPEVSLIFGDAILVKTNGNIQLITAHRDFAYSHIVAQFLPDGQLDPSFGWDGIVNPLPTVESESSWDIKDVKTMPNHGSMYLAPCGNGQQCLIKLTDTGLDPSFGTGGMAGVLPQFEEATAFAVQADGKIIVGGYGHAGFGREFMLSRHKADGTIDASFGNNGQVLTDFDGNSDEIEDLVLQADRKILAIGTVNAISGAKEFGIARYLPHGSLDPSFADNGKIKARTLIDGYASQIGLLPNGKIVAAGTSDLVGSSFGSTLAIRLYTNDITTQLDEAPENWQMGPNPTQDFLHITHATDNASFHWQLLDISGSRIAQGTSQQENTTLDLRSYAPGLYTLVIGKQGHQSAWKIRRLP